MAADKRSSPALVARVLRQILETGESVEIEGLGRFQPKGNGLFELTPLVRPRVFLAYVEENRSSAERLYRDLGRHGYDAWIDCRKLLPGQNWPRAIEDAIETSDYFIACFSTAAVRKRGAFQSEIRYALDCARRVPLDDVFVTPVRFEACPVPRRIKREFQYIDLYPDWRRGLRKLLAALKKQRASTSGVWRRAS